MNQPPLNPDGVLNAMDILMAETDADARAAEWARKVATRVLEGYFAAAVPEVTSVKEVPGEKLAAQIILSVDVMLGLDPGTNTPDAFEPPYEYLVIRGAEALKAEAIIQSGIFQIVGEGVFDDADPDSVLVEAVTNGLSSLSPTMPEVRP